MLMHLGLDSTDSPKGGCTTFTASKIIDALFAADTQIMFVGYPKLVRLNPNIPIKTRGNAAITISFETRLSAIQVFEIAKAIVIKDKEENVGEPNKKPGLVLKTGKINPIDIYKRGLKQVIQLDELNLKDLADYYYPNNANGLIGAICALYSDFTKDHTFELISYRIDEFIGTERQINIDKLKSADLKYKSTFSSIDHKKNRELIAPSGPDPIFCGIRGENHVDLTYFMTELAIQEKLDSYTIFITNQGTDSHMYEEIIDIVPYNVFSGKLLISERPINLPGGHIKLKVRIGEKIIDCMAFEPSKELRDIARLLLPGDCIFAHANVKENEFGISLALEFFMIVDLANDLTRSPPKCTCGSTTKSAGALKAYKCPKCKKTTQLPKYNSNSRDMKLFLGQRVYASPSAQRHLTRPRSRLHRRNVMFPDQKLSYSEIRKKL
jgi:tRNA(Ile2)-agmatinylcytidine synthase